MKKALLLLLAVYQKIFTLFSYGSCRYYPTCSEYAKWQIEQNSLPKALFSSLIRILRCNQFFEGGIDYPVVKKDFKNSLIGYKNIKNRNFLIKYWFVPKRGNEYYLIKSFKKEKNPC